MKQQPAGSCNALLLSALQFQIALATSPATEQLKHDFYEYDPLFVTASEQLLSLKRLGYCTIPHLVDQDTERLSGPPGLLLHLQSVFYSLFDLGVLIHKTWGRKICIQVKMAGPRLHEIHQSRSQGCAYYQIRFSVSDSTRLF